MVAINSFAKTEKHSKSNATESSRWVSADSEVGYIQHPGPDNSVRIQMQRSNHISHAVPIENHDLDEVALRQSRPPLLQARIHDAADLRNLLDFTAQLPSVDSRSSGHDENGISPSPQGSHSSKSRVRTLMSSLNSDTIEDSRSRKGSSATIFPSFPHNIEKPGSEATEAQGIQDSWKIVNVYRSARAIYEAGPEGEGQKVWSSHKQSRKQKQVNARAEYRLFHAQRPAPPAPLERIPLRKMVVPDVSSHVSEEYRVSGSSCEVPVRIGREIQQCMHANKALPPVPQLHLKPTLRLHRGTASEKPLPPVPKQSSRSNREKKVSKPLPSAPQSQPVPPSPPRKETKAPERTKPSIEESSIGSTSSRAHHRVQYHTGDSHHLEFEQPNISNKKLSPWWKSRTGKKPELNSLGILHEKESKNKLRGAGLKPQISRPRPITAIQKGRTANLAVECGGVGGPGAAGLKPKSPGYPLGSSSPFSHVGSRKVGSPPFEKMGERQRGKQNVTQEHKAGVPPAKHWRTKLHVPHSFAENRRDSDASFGCVGIEDIYEVDVTDVRSPTQLQENAVRKEGQFRPEPLFSGTRSGEGMRDSSFYDPYCEVLDEYQS
ncbi:hypothetical protein GQ44DRAFT_822258 [Phaeosphaeriaceae sp. PMI808]|nr:hypothetical protein GQ44DRAFT_822258 [Phaeosphaeriaceae sp. PMI808]